MVAEDGAVDDGVRGVVEVEVALDQGLFVPGDVQSLLGRVERGRGEGRGGEELEVDARGAGGALVGLEQAVDVSQQRSCRRPSCVACATAISKASPPTTSFPPRTGTTNLDSPPPSSRC